MVSAFMHGDEDRWGFAKQGIKQKGPGALPHRFTS
jgi:hypothetical protein